MQTSTSAAPSADEYLKWRTVDGHLSDSSHTGDVQVRKLRKTSENPEFQALRQSLARADPWSEPQDQSDFITVYLIIHYRWDSTRFLIDACRPIQHLQMSSVVMSLPVYGTLNINNLLLGLDLSIDKLHTIARHGFYLMVDIDSGFLTGCVLSPLSALIVGIYQRPKTE